jgi:hypothetical protein
LAGISIACSSVMPACSRLCSPAIDSPASFAKSASVLVNVAFAPWLVTGRELLGRNLQ